MSYNFSIAPCSWTIKKNMGFFDACNKGVMCSIGRGCVDYNLIFSALDKIGFDGWITVEQERDPKNFEGALEDIRLSFKFLAESENS